MIRATLLYLFVGLYILILAPFGLVWTLFAGNVRLIYRLARFCVRAAGCMFGIKAIIRGQGKIAPATTYLFLSNHQGNFDAPVLLHAIPRDWKALIKKEMMQLPIFSLLLRRAQFVPIERFNPKKAQAGIDTGARLLIQGHSFVAFPEGTRSRDGNLGEFKKGVFVMAINAQIPIIPVTILNSARIQPPGSYAIRPGNIEVVFHDPIPTKGLTLENRNELVQLTRDAIASELKPASI